MSHYNRRIPHIHKSNPEWRKLRRSVLDAEPLCRSCASLGYTTPADTVDHIVPRARGGTDDLANLQPLCNTCHDAKTDREKKGGVDDRVLVSLDGSKSGRPTTIEPRKTGNSPRARFLVKGFNNES